MHRIPSSLPAPKLYRIIQSQQYMIIHSSLKFSYDSIQMKYRDYTILPLIINKIPNFSVFVSLPIKLQQ